MIIKTFQSVDFHQSKLNFDIAQPHHTTSPLLLKFIWEFSFDWRRSTNQNLSIIIEVEYYEKVHKHIANDSSLQTVSALHAPAWQSFLWWISILLWVKRIYDWLWCTHCFKPPVRMVRKSSWFADLKLIQHQKRIKIPQLLEMSIYYHWKSD